MLKQICDRCGYEEEKTVDNSFGSVTIKEQSYLLCPKCVLGYDALALACQIKTESALFLWVHKEIK